MLMQDVEAVDRSEVLIELNKKYEDDESKRYEEFINICQTRTIVIKEVRFQKGVPESLMTPEIQILHLVRDPRAVVHSQLNLKSFCNSGSAKNCARPLCITERDVIMGIKTYLATLEGNSSLQTYQFKRIKFEDVALKPLIGAQYIYNWAKLGKISLLLEKWVKENTEAESSDGPFSTKRNSQEVINNWRGSGKMKGLSELQVKEINEECGDVLDECGYEYENKTEFT